MLFSVVLVVDCTTDILFFSRFVFSNLYSAYTYACAMTYLGVGSRDAFSVSSLPWKGVDGYKDCIAAKRRVRRT